MKWTFLALMLALGGCYAVVEPGHRALYFDPLHGGLRHEILPPGRHRMNAWGRMDDFDITYSRHEEQIHTKSSEGLDMDLKVAVRYRPVVSELYDLDTEIGQNYYDEVLGPEFRSATRGVFARHSYLELMRNNEKIEDEVEAEVRRRIAGKHIEISSVTMEEVAYAPEIGAAVRAKLVGEQEALRKKAALEADALRQRLELEHEAEREKLQTEAELRKKEKERKLAAEQSAIDELRAHSEADTRLTSAKAEAAAVSVLAKAHAEEKHAEAATLTPLMVMIHAYDALARLGGNGTHIMLGDWSKIPSFLFPQLPGLHLTTPTPSVANR